MAEPDIRRLPIEEFRSRGYLHEVNRLVLHPLGLALEVNITMQPTCRVDIPAPVLDQLQRVLDAAIEWGHGGLTVQEATTLKDAIARGQWLLHGDGVLGSIWDCREEAEGVYFDESVFDPEKAKNVLAEVMARREARMKALGYVVQPVPGEKVLTTNYTDPEAQPQAYSAPPGYEDVEFET